MALLQSKYFKHIEKGYNIIHKSVDATYTEFSINDRLIFQIDTYGTQKRKVFGKVSQSIQFDKEMAEVLVSKLCEAFGLK